MLTVRTVSAGARLVVGRHVIVLETILQNDLSLVASVVLGLLATAVVIMRDTASRVRRPGGPHTAAV